MPMSSSANAGWAANRRQAAAILVSPAHRVRPMTVLRKAAITCGILPQRTWDRSSSKVTSRTQCDLFSMCQCPRTNASKRAASARSGARLVTPAPPSSGDPPLLFAADLPLQLEHLPQTRPVTVAYQYVTRLQPSLLDAPVPPVHGLRHRAGLRRDGREGKDGLNVGPELGLRSEEPT